MNRYKQKTQTGKGRETWTRPCISSVPAQAPAPVVQKFLSAVAVAKWRMNGMRPIEKEKSLARSSSLDCWGRKLKADVV